jgi:hypothetical protein
VGAALVEAPASWPLLVLLSDDGRGHVASVGAAAIDRVRAGPAAALPSRVPGDTGTRT